MVDVGNKTMGAALPRAGDVTVQTNGRGDIHPLSGLRTLTLTIIMYSSLLTQLTEGVCIASARLCDTPVCLDLITHKVIRIAPIQS